MSEKLICNMTFDEIKELINLVSDKKLGKIDIKVQDSHIIIEDRKCPPPAPMMAAPAVQPPFLPVQEAAPAVDKAVKNSSAESEEKISGNVISSPLVGTFYAAPSPDKPPFVTEGQKVKKGDVIFIIESMKLMNEVQSDYDGVVKKICVENASPVEFAQPIMIIE